MKVRLSHRPQRRGYTVFEQGRTPLSTVRVAKADSFETRNVIAYRTVDEIERVDVFSQAVPAAVDSCFRAGTGRKEFSRGFFYGAHPRLRSRECRHIAEGPVEMTV